MLVKIPNDFIRQKVVEQEIWHIGTSLFYVAQWSAQVAAKLPSFDSIPLWAHVRGVPFDLYTQEGLSLVASLIGFPVEADEFTIKMVSLEVAHLKVRADCTKPMPSIVELIRDSGDVIQVSVEYPWLPPTCACCKHLGHTEARCPNAKWAPAKGNSNQGKTHKATYQEKGKGLANKGNVPANNQPKPPKVQVPPMASKVQNSPLASEFPSSILEKDSRKSSLQSSTVNNSAAKATGADLLLEPEVEVSTAALPVPGSGSSLSFTVLKASSGDSEKSIILASKDLVSSDGFQSVRSPAHQKSIFQAVLNSSKKRKSTNLSSRGSLSPPISVNPFACLADQLALVDPSVATAQSTTLVVFGSLDEQSSTPATGSSLIEGKIIL